MRETNLLALFLFILLFHYVGNTDQAIGGNLKEQAIEKRIIELVNEVRVKGIKCGSKFHESTQPVVWDERLGQASLNHSLDMTKKGFLSHTGSDGSSTECRLSKVGYRWITYGENVGKGHRTPEEAVRGWLKSKSHCEKIMNPAFKEAGSAYAKGSGRIYWTLILASPKP